MAPTLKSQRVRNRRTLPPLVLSKEQIDRIMAVTNANPRLHITRDVVRILLETGMRLGELRNLRVSDVDVANNRLYISGTKTEGRFVPLSPRGLNALQSLHSQHSSSAFVLGEQSSHVLRRVSLTFRKIASEVGATDHSLHSLRHVFAMRLASVGLDPIFLAHVMGNSNPRRILRYYSKLDRS
jgi:integrase